MTLIPLSEWAKRNGITYQDAIDMARKGNLAKDAKREKRQSFRWMVDDKIPLPEKTRKRKQAKQKA